jgi:2-oxoglutarate ferredoxin oxidoreductase subunit delta
MPEVKVNNDRCKGCEMCVITCPKHLLELDRTITNSKGYHPAHITDQKACTGCGSCAVMCPDVAIRVEV